MMAATRRRPTPAAYAVVATVDSPFYVGGATDTLVVAQAAQTLTFPNPGNKSYGDPRLHSLRPRRPACPVAYSVVSGPATVSGGLVTITGVGAVVLRATQVGNANYLAAADVDVTFTVAKGTATVTLGNLDQVYDGTPKTVTFTHSPPG